MRTFSRLRALCAYPEAIERPNRRRDEAGAIGTTFHSFVEAWARAVAEGKDWRPDGAPELVQGWLARMREVWAPPPGLEVEVAMGLLDRPEPKYLPVVEIEPHVYLPAHLSVTAAMWKESSDEQRHRWQEGMLTAGRADLLELRRGEVDVVDVVDIKTGSSYLGEPRQLRQLIAQGIAATLRAGADGFIPGIYYARLGVFDRGDGQVIWRNSPEWDEAWDHVATAARMPATPQVGGWCLSCWEKDACPAYPGREAA
jgi:hypothetical protein